MFDSILEFITQAASSSTLIFCFCNLIIVYILVDLKPSLSVHQESEVPLKPSLSVHQESEVPLSLGTNQSQGANSECLVQKGTESEQVVQVSLVQEEELEAEVKSIEVYSIETIGNDDCNNEEVEKKEEEKDNEEEEEEDDELRRRVEEFIEKVNKGWKEELLRTSRLV